MSIKVVCGCGFCTVVPANWRGKRVECKCGRSFVVGATPGAEAPAGAPLSDDRYPPARSSLPDREPPTTSEFVRGPRPSGPADEPSRAGAAPVPPRPLPVGTLVRPAPPDPVADPPQPVRRSGPARGAKLFLVTSILLALVGVGGTYYVTQRNPSSLDLVRNCIRAMLPTEDARPGASSETTESGSPPRTGSSPEAARAEVPAQAAPNDSSADPATSALAGLMDLVPEDGLLVTGMFGSQYLRLAIGAAAQQQIDALVEQLREHERQLRSREISLEQWYATCRKSGEALLGVLTDAQRDQMRAMLQRREVARVHLVEYAARIRPELAVAQVPWRVKPDAERTAPITQSTFNVPGDGTLRTFAPSPRLALFRQADQDPGRLIWEVWNLARDERETRCEMDLPAGAVPRLLSRSGEFLVYLTADDQGGDARVDVWSTRSASLVGSQEIPRVEDRAGYRVRDCVAQRVIALSQGGYWVWNVDTGTTREISFPPTMPDAAEGFAVSAGGEYLVVAHPHVRTIESREYGFVEICLYRLDTGELLGNLVWERDYRRADVSAVAWSVDGRELALLCDFMDPQPTRALVQLNALDGQIVRVVEGLEPAAEGPAHRHGLRERDLVGLAAGSGWLVNLQQVVDGETGAVLELALPALAPAEADSAAVASRRVVEVVSASSDRLLVIVAEEPEGSDSGAVLRAEFVPLPKLGPFM